MLAAVLLSNMCLGLYLLFYINVYVGAFLLAQATVIAIDLMTIYFL